MKKIVFFDTETTGLRKEDKITQLAYSYIQPGKHIYGSFSSKPKRVTESVLVNPEILISPEASMITGVSNSTVKNLTTFNKTSEYKEINLLSKDKETYFVAYNAPFDVNMLSKDNIELKKSQIIDLYRIAKHLYKNETTTDRNGDTIPLANNKLQYFRYLLDFDIDSSFLKLQRDYGLNEVQGHEALSDVLVLEHFFNLVKTIIIEKQNNEEDLEISSDLDWFDIMLDLTSKPVLEPNITFGNVFEKGTNFNHCLNTTYEQYGRVKNGFDYLDWCSENLSLSVDTAYSIKIHFFNNLINGKIPYNHKFLKYINYGLVFETDIDKINQGLNIINKPFEYHSSLQEKFISSMDKQYNENVDKELGDWFPALFQKRYVEHISS